MTVSLLKKSLLSLTILSSFLLCVPMSLAQNANLSGDIVNKLGSSQKESGLHASTPGELIGNLIHILLGILGIIFVVLTVYAGYLYMTAGGNEDQIATAKKLIFNAVIGLIIIMMSWAITDFILWNVYGATTDLGFNN